MDKGETADFLKRSIGFIYRNQINQKKSKNSVTQNV
jgi:hypothetical protein